MKNLLIAASALALVSVPAHAQLLGGGGIGGMVGGALGGAGNIGAGPIGMPLQTTTDTIRSTTRGAVDATGSTSGSQKANARSGSVEANRRASASGTADLTQLANTPIAPMTGSVSGTGSAQGSGSAQTQLIGTDALTSAAQGGVTQARGAASPLVSRVRTGASNGASLATGAANGVANTAGTKASSGNASGSASGSGMGMTGLTSMPLAAAGSAAAAGQSAFAVTPGMPVLAADGTKIGKVKQVIANNEGQVQQVVMTARGTRTTVPANLLSANGSGLVMAQGSGSAQSGASAAAAGN